MNSSNKNKRKKSPVAKGGGLLGQVRHDWRGGVLHEWKRILPTVLAALLPCAALFVQAKVEVDQGVIGSTPVLGDYLIYLFRGMRVYVYNPDEPFKLPVIWICLNLHLAFIVGNYPFNDLATYGQQSLIRSGRRGQWWAGKCLWAVMCTGVFYLLVYLTVFVFALCTGGIDGLKLLPGQEIGAYYCEVDFTQTDPVSALVFVVVMPIVASLALTQLQLALSFFTRPIYSYMIIVALLLVSAYITSPWLIGNYTMLLRSPLVLPEGGIPLWLGPVVFPLLAILSAVAGWRRFERYDILETS